MPRVSPPKHPPRLAGGQPFPLRNRLAQFFFPLDAPGSSRNYKAVQPTRNFARMQCALPEVASHFNDENSYFLAGKVRNDPFPTSFIVEQQRTVWGSKSQLPGSNRDRADPNRATAGSSFAPLSSKQQFSRSAPRGGPFAPSKTQTRRPI
jgi:hypothetical protein